MLLWQKAALPRSLNSKSQRSPSLCLPRAGDKGGCCWPGICSLSGSLLPWHESFFQIYYRVFLSQHVFLFLPDPAALWCLRPWEEVYERVLDLCSTPSVEGALTRGRSWLVSKMEIPGFGKISTSVRSKAFRPWEECAENLVVTEISGKEELRFGFKGSRRDWSKRNDSGAEGPQYQEEHPRESKGARVF